MIEKAERERIQADIENALPIYADDLQRFQRAGAAFFSGLAGDQTFTRRPGFALRLVSPGEPLAKLSARPDWRKSALQLVPSDIAIELIVERVQVNGMPLPHREVRVEVGDTRPPMLTAWSYRHGLSALHRLGDTVRRFLANPGAAFANGSDHCCLCGRHLTDSQSRSRGVGPECFARATAFTELVERLGAAGASVAADVADRNTLSAVQP